MLATECYSAEAITETEVVAYVLKEAPFKELINQSSGFRSLVFEDIVAALRRSCRRSKSLFAREFDVRLAERLLELMGAIIAIETTQQALAADLGTAREVIGRMLNSFERSGWVKLSRGAIDIRDASALSMLIGGKRD